MTIQYLPAAENRNVHFVTGNAVEDQTEGGKAYSAMIIFGISVRLQWEIQFLRMRIS